MLTGQRLRSSAHSSLMGPAGLRTWEGRERWDTNEFGEGARGLPWGPLLRQLPAVDALQGARLHQHAAAEALQGTALRAAHRARLPWLACVHWVQAQMVLHLSLGRLPGVDALQGARLHQHAAAKALQGTSLRAAQQALCPCSPAHGCCGVSQAVSLPLCWMLLAGHMLAALRLLQAVSIVRSSMRNHVPQTRLENGPDGAAFKRSA